MKRNTLAKKLMAALLTGTMIMSMGMTSFAQSQDGVIEANGSSISKVTLTKKISGADNEYAPNYTFTFSVSNDLTENELNYKADGSEANKNLSVKAGNMDAVGSHIEVPFVPEEGDPTAAGKVASSSVALRASEYSEPGIYRYKITEDDVNYGGITKDSTVYYMDVYVTDANEGKPYETDFEAFIKYVVVFKMKGETPTKSDLIFDNKYKTNKLTVKKIVAGNQGNRKQEFSFTIEINGQPGDRFTVTNGTVTYGEGGKATIAAELHHDEEVSISGLSQDDTYMITETDYSSEGYETAITGADRMTGLVATGTVNVNDETVTYTNTKSADTPTGIAMTFAPYAVMVAFAGVFAVMFLRKKREDF